MRKKYKHLSYEERNLIFQYHHEGVSIGEISRQLGRNKSTIFRELRRNSDEGDYKLCVAQERYISRRQKGRRIDKDPRLRTYILEHLHKGFSPSAIAKNLKSTRAVNKRLYVNHESIYQWIKLDAQRQRKYCGFSLFSRPRSKTNTKKKT